MVHPSTDNFSGRGLGWARRPSYLGVYLAMGAIKIIAAALLVAAVAAVTVSVTAGQAREHILQGTSVAEKREHIL